MTFRDKHKQIRVFIEATIRLAPLDALVPNVTTKFINVGGIALLPG